MENEKFIEQLYENVILKRYSNEIDSDSIKWIDHGKVGMDSWAHHFESNGQRYVLLCEDFPDGSYPGDDQSHEVIKCGNETSIELKFSDSKELLHITGWYTLFREKLSR